MEKEIAIDLIKLDVLDRTTSEESEVLQFFKTDKDFPFEILGNYQNLLAIIAASSGLTPVPDELKNQVFTRLYSIKNFKQIKENKFEEEILKQIEENKEETQKIDVQIDEPYELVETVSETLSAEKFSKKPSIEELKLNRGGIKLKDPNFSNIHLIIEDNKNKPVKQKEMLVQKTESDKIEIVTKPETKDVEKIEPPKENKVVVNNESSEINLELTKVDKRLRRKSRTVSNSNGVSFGWHRRKLVIVSLILVVVSTFIYLFINSGQTNPVEIAHSQPLKGELKISSEQSSLQTETQVEEILKEDIMIQTEIKVDEKPVENIQPILPESSKLIEIPLEETTERPKTVVFENLKEKSIELPVTPPVENKKMEIESPYFVAVEEMPEPIGGLSVIQSKIVYPEIARRAGVEGKVFVLAFVDENGKVTNAEIIKGIGSGCDEAALDAVISTKFKPGIQRGNPVKVKVTIPIVFKK